MPQTIPALIKYVHRTTAFKNLQTNTIRNTELHVFLQLMREIRLNLSKRKKVNKRFVTRLLKAERFFSHVMQVVYENTSGQMTEEKKHIFTLIDLFGMKYSSKRLNPPKNTGKAEHLYIIKLLEALKNEELPEPFWTWYKN